MRNTRPSHLTYSGSTLAHSWLTFSHSVVPLPELGAPPVAGEESSMSATLAGAGAGMPVPTPRGRPPPAPPAGPAAPGASCMACTTSAKTDGGTTFW